MSIRKLPTGRWEARARVEGRHLKKMFERKTDAVAWEAKIRHDRDRGIHVDMSNRTTVAEYFSQWLDARVIRDSSREAYGTLLSAHLKPTGLGSRPIVRVRPSEVQAWARDRSEVLGPVTLRKYAGVLRSAFTTALQDGLIGRNPVPMASRLSLPKVDKPKIVPLTVGQVQAWADHADHRIRAMIIVQAGLGLRIGELKALRVQDVNFLRREVQISEQINKNTGRRAPLKTPNSRRAVPLPSMAAEVLAEHIRRNPPGPDRLIFTQALAEMRSDGRRCTPSTPRTRMCAGVWNSRTLAVLYRDAARAAGLPAGTSSHDLRHHYASVLLDAGESVHAVAERIGDRPEMVLRIYGHMMPDREDSTRRAVDAAWRAAEDAPKTQDHP